MTTPLNLCCALGLMAVLPGCRVRADVEQTAVMRSDFFDGPALASAATAALPAPAPRPPPPPPPPVEAPPGAVVFALGGLDSLPLHSGAALRAVDEATLVLVAGSDALDAAVTGVAQMEADPRLNAGVGSRLRLDADEPEMDAAVMASDGRFGAVCTLARIEHPVEVAHRIVTTPHLVLCGEGALAFGLRTGATGRSMLTETRRVERDALRQLILRDEGHPWNPWLRQASTEPGADDASGEGGSAPARAPSAEPEEAPPSDTVGVVVRAADGTFAVAASSGGPALALRGRVGDVPIQGAALYAGPKGAVVLSSSGEERMRDQLARRVYEKVATGFPASLATKWAVDVVGDHGGLAIAVVTSRDDHFRTTRDIAWARRTEDGVESGTPVPDPPSDPPSPAGSARPDAQPAPPASSSAAGEERREPPP